MGEVMDNAGTAVHYSAVQPGTPVFDVDERPVGEVTKVLDNYREHILDGIVLDDGTGTLRFIDGPEVSRTFERGVFLGITAADVAEHGPPDYGVGSLGEIGSKLGSLFKRR